jgi:DNA-binding transcriptional LysR family regulator
MNFHQLEIFYVVAQRLSITGAATELRLTQPAVSLQVRRSKRMRAGAVQCGGPQLT